MRKAYNKLLLHNHNTTVLQGAILQSVGGCFSKKTFPLVTVFLANLHKPSFCRERNSEEIDSKILLYSFVVQLLWNLK